MTTDLDTLVDSLLAPSQEEAPNPVEDQIEDAERKGRIIQHPPIFEGRLQWPTGTT